MTAFWGRTFGYGPVYLDRNPLAFFDPTPRYYRVSMPGFQSLRGTATTSRYPVAHAPCSSNPFVVSRCELVELKWSCPGAGGGVYYASKVILEGPVDVPYW